MQLKVLTLNIWDIPFWFSTKRHYRIHQLGPYLKEIDPHLICLQEAFDVKHRTFIHEALGRKKFHIVEEFDETRRVLLFKRFDLTGGLVIFSKFPIKESSFSHFRRPLRLALPERIGRKGFLRVLIETPAGPLLVVNTHLHSGPKQQHRQIRYSQFKEVLGELDESRYQFSTILAGDLNEDIYAEPKDFLKLTEANGFEDPTIQLGTGAEATVKLENPYGNMWFYTRPRSKRIDYIFFRNAATLKITPQNYQVLPMPAMPLSDHNPVLAFFNIES
jgi:endonuclease/exonuclease/phosphatase family metal-dependent hydrolase